VAQQPRMLVGRSFRTGKPMSQTVDSLRAQTMSLGGFRCFGAQTYSHTFVGLGVCCTGSSWCDAACSGHDGELVLFGWDASGTAPYLLAPLGVTDAVSVARGFCWRGWYAAECGVLWPTGMPRPSLRAKGPRLAHYARRPRLSLPWTPKARFAARTLPAQCPMAFGKG